MKILLVSVNASYMHTNVAIRSLKAYAEKNLSAEKVQVQIEEYTINQPVGEVLRSIGFAEADVVLFSTYIWNAEYVCKLMPEIKKLMPECILGAGGPEFGYSGEKYLKDFLGLDFIMHGEGEKSFVELAQCLCGDRDFSKVKGLYFRKDDGSIIFSGEQRPIENLDELPFAYPEILDGDYDPDHKIYYYESTRGCPFGCSYCLSSVDKRVRFKSLEKVQAELKIFLDANVKLVKFIDRTYNLNPDRYIPIWNFILKNHNGKTMFHFEIEAEYLSDEALDFLQKIPKGVMQFEMGVQSANKKTLRAVNRSDNVELLAEKILRIPHTIHQHLDLIAGLPYEDLESFGRSYDFVMNLKPDALQLGFLKILRGTQMSEMALENGWKWMETPVYETFSTPYLSFRDVAFLKEVEVLTDAYWNKKIFSSVMNYVFRKTSPWKFIVSLAAYGNSRGTFTQARRELYWFNLLNDFLEEKNGDDIFSSLDVDVLKDLLRYDFVSTGKKGAFPEWYVHVYDKNRHKAMLDEKEVGEHSRIGFANSEYEIFSCNVESKFPEEERGHFEILIRY